MAIRFAPHAHKVKVRHIATGQITDCWPVDAREMTADGTTYEYVRDEPAPLPDVGERGHRAVAPAETPQTPLDQRLSIRAKLDAKSFTEIKALSKKVGIVGNLSRSDLVEAIIPHVIGGTVSLEEVPHFTLPNPQFASAAEG